MFLKSSVLASLFLILLIIGYPNNSTKFSGYPLTATANEIAVSNASDDVTGYISLGVDVADDGKVSAENLWRVRLFGPGMFYLYGSIIAILGSNVQLPLLILLISACLWSLLIVKYYGILSLRIGVPATLLWISILLTCSWFSTGLLNENLLGADSIGLLIFSITIISSFTSSETKHFLFSGILLGCLTLISARYYVILLLISLYFLAVFAANLIKASLGSCDWTFWRQINIKRPALIILCAFLTGVPWRLISSQNILPGNYGIRTSEYYWAHRWMSDDFNYANGIGFLSEGGANWACEIDPQTCLRINAFEDLKKSNFNGSGHSSHEFRTLAVTAVRKHPFLFLENRFNNFIHSWFALYNAPPPQMRLFQLFSFGCLLYNCFRGGLNILKRKWFEPSVFSSLMFIGLISPFLIFQIEYRYIQNIQLLSFAMFPFMFSDSIKSLIAKHLR